MSSQLAGRLRKVVTPWSGPAIRSAGGHLLTPLGVCTARIKIRDAYFPACFLVLRECSKPLILGLDFLYEYGAIIDLRELLVTFSTNRAVITEAEPRCMALRLCDGHVTLPPRASVFVSVKCDSDFTCGIAEANVPLLLERQISVARGVVEIRNYRTDILLTNFSAAPQHLHQKTDVFYLTEIAGID